MCDYRLIRYFITKRKNIGIGLACRTKVSTAILPLYPSFNVEPRLQLQESQTTLNIYLGEWGKNLLENLKKKNPDSEPLVSIEIQCYDKRPVYKTSGWTPNRHEWFQLIIQRDSFIRFFRRKCLMAAWPSSVCVSVCLCVNNSSEHFLPCRISSII